MAKHHSSRQKGVRASGRRGPRGRRGPAGKPANGLLVGLTVQMERVVSELKVQFTRIAQIQAQLDQIGRGESIVSSEPLRMKRPTN